MTGLKKFFGGGNKGGQGGKGGDKKIFDMGARSYPSVPAKPVFNAEMFRPHAFQSTRIVLRGGFASPRIVIGNKAYLDMYYISGNAGYNEVGWLGTVRRVGDVLHVEEIFLFDQQVSSGSTELNSEHIGEVATKLIMAGEIDKVNALKFWGHVHPGNSTSPSTQDEDTMKVLENGNEWFLRGIFGRNGRAEFTLFDYTGGVRYNDVPWSFSLDECSTRREEMKALVEELVHTATYHYPASVSVNVPVYRGVEDYSVPTSMEDDPRANFSSSLGDGDIELEIGDIEEADDKSALSQ